MLIGELNYKYRLFIIKRRLLIIFRIFKEIINQIALSNLIIKIYRDIIT